MALVYTCLYNWWDKRSNYWTSSFTDTNQPRYLRGWRDVIGVTARPIYQTGVKKIFFKQSKRYKRQSFFDSWNFSACSADGPRNTLRRINHVHLFALTSKYCSICISWVVIMQAHHPPTDPLIVLCDLQAFCTFCIFNFLHLHIILSLWLQASCLLHLLLLLHPISRLLLFVQWLL